MATIQKIHVAPLGEFTISFSTRFFRFEISKWPEGVIDKAQPSGKTLNTWYDVQEELSYIKKQYLQEVCFLRKVIVIQLKTSESLFTVMKDNWRGELKEERTDDYMSTGQGFQIHWYIMDEYLYPGDRLKYRIVEYGKNCKGHHRSDRIDLLPQLLYGSNGEIRVLDYQEDLHIFLKSLEKSISDMVAKIVSYFDIDEKKFLENFKNNQLKLT